MPNKIRGVEKEHGMALPTCCSMASFHHKSSRMHLVAMVKSRPTPPAFREDINMLIFSSSRNLLIFACLVAWDNFPESCHKW